jgi:uncharacterized protein (DUF4415 family)
VLRTPADRTRVTIRLGNDVLACLRNTVDQAGGGDYEDLINQALHEFMGWMGEAFESTLRRVIREELRRAG